MCDDTSYARRAKSYMNKALDANIPAITTGGIYPGVSNGSVMLSLQNYQCIESSRTHTSKKELIVMKMI